MRNVRKYWESRGKVDLKSGLVTHRDIDQVKLEIGQVLRFLKPQDTLLDIGCGNGYSSSFYAKKCKRVLGLDYAANMVRQANKKFKAKNLLFKQQDVTVLDGRYGTFSVILSTRCLINIKSWEKQKQAIKNLYRCLNGGGYLILMEGTQQGRRALNGLRVASGLKAMPPVWHNLDFDEIKLKGFLKGMFDIVRDTRFGFYDVLTRVYYPMLIKPKEPRYATAYHQKAREFWESLSVDPAPQYSREFVWILRKRTKT